MSGDELTDIRSAQRPIDVAATGGLGAAAASEPGTISPSGEEEEDTLARSLGFAEFHAQYVSGYIQLADAKAGASFAVSSAVLAFLVNSETFGQVVRFEATWPIGVTGVLGFLMLLASSVLSFLVILPRTPKGGDDVVSWGSVAALPAASEFVRRVKGLGDSELVGQRLSHSYNLSKVCTRKYLLLRLGMIAGAAGLVASFFWLVLASGAAPPV